MPVSDVGTRVVKFVRQRLQVDAEWGHPRERGFSWWPGSLAQNVWAEPPYESDGITLSRVHVRTDLLRGVPDGDALGALTPVMQAADLSGLVWSGEDGAMQFASSFYVHEQTEASLGLIVALASALQVAGAHALVAGLAAAVGGVPDASAPPGRAARRRPDEILDVIENLVAPQGMAPSVYPGPGFTQAVEWLEEQGFFSNGDEAGLTAEFPFGSMTSLMTMKTDEPHPLLGNGLSLRLILPVMPAEAETVQMALKLNTAEVNDHTDTHFAGSWCPGDRGLAHHSFLPNLLGGGSGQAMNFTFTTARRALWAAGVFEQEFAPGTPHSMERLLALDDAEFGAIIDNLPPGTEREETIELMAALRNAHRESNG